MNVASAFDLRQSVGVIVRGEPTGGYYMLPALDGSRSGMFYAQNTGSIPWYGMPTLAYHEAIPEHHFQIAIAQHLELPNIRRASEFTAYVEGWALYAERLAWELGFYRGIPMETWDGCRWKPSGRHVWWWIPGCMLNAGASTRQWILWWKTPVDHKRLCKRRSADILASRGRRPRFTLGICASWNCARR
jgi:hypothetical protein